MVTITWHTCKYKVHKLHQWYILTRGCTSGGVYLRIYLWWSLLEDVPLVGFTWGCTSGGVYLRMCLWWSLLEDVPLVEFTWGCASGGVYLRMYLWWGLLEDVPLVEFMYLLFTGMPGESYCRWLRSLLLCCVTSFKCWLMPVCVDSKRAILTYTHSSTNMIDWFLLDFCAFFFYLLVFPREYVGCWGPACLFQGEVWCLQCCSCGLSVCLWTWIWSCQTGGTLRFYLIQTVRLWKGGW